jgi:hypothetical protein
VTKDVDILLVVLGLVELPVKPVEVVVRVSEV